MFAASALIEKINSHMAGLDFAREPYSLYEPIRYVLSLGGKRIRPLLMLMAYNLYRDDIEKVMPVATGFEIYHNFTLLHDDVMDEADIRRGKPTVHKVWNENAAILSGDAMYSLACRYVAQAPAEYVVEVVKRFNEMALQICEGQQLDMEFESRNSVSEEEYLQMIRLKTSVLLANSLAVGGLLGGASDEAVERLYHFGLNLGMAFQLKDDLLDVYGDASVFGKKIGGDILCNKKTYLLIKALEHATPEQREALCAWLVMEQYVSSEKIAAVTALYNEIGVKHFCEIKIEEYSRHAAEYLMAINVDAAKKAELEILMKQMVHRIV